ncbi:putative hinge domain of cleavage stimulation factor subunit 2 [Lyophyllum shimeji]|uniref:Hinge domain of cleavage stimulation factor subunit 2 n=1 Tax=Lyophyllum shimeji TaxID=47721 RepID=A0A9P3USL4_LYOSH|nr:putative hinge domain of cleavage stimulation factor subunit 2 [Lyophyllum shimeji]
MSNQNLAAEQLLELLLQLKKTTPAAARSILNGQPQIAYALMTLMVTIGAVNFEVFQKTLAEFGSKSAAAAPAAAHPTAHPSTSSTPVPALPPHLHPQAQASAYRNATPPTQPQPQAYAYQNGGHDQAYAHGYQQPQGYGYGQPPPPSQPASQHAYHGYGAPAPTPVQTPPNLPDTLAAIPDEQKALIMRVITMTPEQIHALPPTERQTYIQLRATLGVPT